MAEYKAINISKNLEYKKQNVTIFLNRFDEAQLWRYKKKYFVPFLKFLQIVPEEDVKILAGFTLSGQRLGQSALKKQKSEKQLEDIKRNPIYHDTHEKLEEHH